MNLKLLFIFVVVEKHVEMYPEDVSNNATKFKTRYKYFSAKKA